MKLTESDLEALRVSLSTRFNDAFRGTPAWWNRVAMLNETDEKIGRMGWLANLPQVRTLVGDRVVQNLAERSYDIVNVDRDMTVGIHRDQLDTKLLGGYAMTFAAMGETAAKWPDTLMVSLLRNGQSALCFDDQYFFDTDHPVSLSNSSLSTYSNYSTGTALTAANYESVRASMMARKGENGLPLGVRPNLLVVPPQLESTAKLIVMADMVPSTAGTASQTNINKGTAEVLVVPELAVDATTWYLLDASGIVKPLVYQRRRTFKFDLIGMDSEHFKKKSEILIIGDAADAGGYGFPQMAHKAVA
jgi:phage major head subunit gpT-like protein